MVLTPFYRIHLPFISLSLPVSLQQHNEQQNNIHLFNSNKTTILKLHNPARTQSPRAPIRLHNCHLHQSWNCTSPLSTWSRRSARKGQAQLHPPQKPGQKERTLGLFPIRSLHIHNRCKLALCLYICCIDLLRLEIFGFIGQRLFLPGSVSISHASTLSRDFGFATFAYTRIASSDSFDCPLK